MSQELMYTSVPRGLRPGSSGFCTAARTEGMSRALEERLELLSGYRALYPAGHLEEGKNPVAHAHWRVTTGRTYSVLSRVCFAGLDYTRRPSKFAHHLVLDPSEQTEAGPAWVMMQSGVMEERWSGEPGIIPAGRAIPTGSNPARICAQWQRVAGDAGWAGVLAEAFVVDAARAAYVIYPPGMEMLPLIDEAVALLPVALRWQVTFNTYFTDLPADQRCAWRCVVAGTQAAQDAPRLATSGIIIDLTRTLGEAPDCGYVELARTGVYSETAAPAAVLQEEPAAPVAEEPAEAYTVEGDGQAEAVEEAEAATDQSWMPPVEATLVEGPAKARARDPRSARLAPWVVAALAPLAAAGAMYAWHLNRAGAERAILEGRIQQLQGDLAQKGRELQEEREKVGSIAVDQKGLEREVGKLRETGDQLRRERDSAHEEIGLLKGRLEQVRQELARATSGRDGDVRKLEREKADLQARLRDAMARAQAASRPAAAPGMPDLFVPQSGKVVVNNQKASHGFARSNVIRPGELLELVVPEAQPAGWHIAPGDRKDRISVTNVAQPQASFNVGMNSGTGEIECDWVDVRARLRTKKVDAESRQASLSGQIDTRQQELAQYQKALSDEKSRSAKQRNGDAVASLNASIDMAGRQIEEMKGQLATAKQEAAAKGAAVAAMDSLSEPIVVEVRFGGAKVGTLTITKD